MATMTEVVRKVTIQASAPGAEQASASLLKLASSQDAVAVATTNTEKATISVQGKLNSLMRTIDAEYASEQKLATIQRTLTAARNEGLISIQRENELLDLASAKYRTVGESAKVMGESLKTVKEVALGLVGGLGAGFALAGLAELPSKIMDAVHEAAGLGHVAEIIGITTKALQQLEFTGAEFHVSTETMDTALERFSKNLAVASTGSGELAKILKANHVIISGDLTKDLANYANLIKNASNEEDRNLLSTTAFGKAAQEMGLLFSEGAKGIKEGADAADAAGAVLSGPALKSAQDLDKQFVDMKVQMDVTFKDFAISTAPLVIKALGGITAAVKTLAATTVNWDLVNQQGATFGGRFGQFKPNVKPTNDNAPPQITVGGATPLGPHDGDTAYRQLTSPTIIPKASAPSATGGWGNDETDMRKQIADLKEQAKAFTESTFEIDKNTAANDLLAKAQKAGVAQDAKVLKEIDQLSTSYAEAKLQLEGVHEKLADQSPWAAMEKSIEHQQLLLAKGAIAWDDYAQNIGKAAETMVDTYGSAANDLLGNITNLTDAMGLQGQQAFDVQKGLSIARAVVAGGEAIVHSFNAGTEIGGPPVGFAFAAVAAAATAAQIASIAASSYQSTAPVAASGGASASTPAAPAAAASPTGPTINLQLVGNNYSRDQVIALIKQINSAVSDGATLNAA